MPVRRLWPAWAVLAAAWLMLAAPAWAVDLLDPLAPTASISASPNPAVTGQTVTFDATGSLDLDGSIVSYEWDLDGDAFFETNTGTTASTSTAYFTAGQKTVRLRVTDNDAKTGEAETTVTVKSPPSANYDFSPSSPATGETIDFTSTSSDPDGSIVSYEWDFDNNGSTDATGPSAQTSYGSAGTFQVRLTVTDDDGLSDLVTKSVTVENRGPSASFDFSPASPATGQTVSFTSTSSDPDGSIAGHAWDFDNNGTTDATGSSAEHAFATPGSKTVRLTVTDGEGDSASTTRTVSVTNQPPSASFTASPVSPLSGQEVTFISTATDPDSEIESWAWDLDGNGSFETFGSIVKRTYGTAGPVTVTLRVRDSSGAEDTATQQLTIGNRPPTGIDFSYSPSTFQTLQDVAFSGSGSDPDGTISSWGWDFNNDGVYERSGKNVTVQFVTPGAHVVRLRATDNLGAAVTTEQVVTTGNRGPTAGFSNSPSSPRTLENVTFSSTSSDPDGTIATLSWDLDGNGVYGDALGPSAVRQFPVAGSYTVGLQVTDNDGATNVLTRTITVSNRSPSAGISVTPGSPTTLEEVTFTSTASDPEGETPFTQTWDLDDDGAYDDASGPIARRSFTTSGSARVRLRVVDARGASATSTKTFSVANRPPLASFVHSPSFPRAFETVTFSSTSLDLDGSISSQAWDLDNDGSFDDGTGTKATRTFTESRSFTVRLRVVDNKGAATVATQTVVIGNRPPVASFSYLPGQPAAGQTVSFFSTASDADSPITSQLWDLDGDGNYNDASGPSAARAYGAGSYVVSLLVTDSDGVSAFVSQALNVTAPPPPAQVTRQEAGSRFLSPFPIVRIAGTIRKRGTRLRRLTVTAPPGSTVTVSCRGGGCPFGRQSSVVKSERSAKGKRRATQVLRIRRFERRTLRSGTMIRLFVTKGTTIGKYTRFKIRRGQAPARLDRCLMPGSRKPAECPTA